MELLVIVTILAMLMALLIPAIGRSTINTRQMQCISNMGQVAKALLTYESRNGELPGRVNEVRIQSKDESKSVRAISWVGAILPYIERNDVWDQIEAGDLHVREPETHPRLDLVICPTDAQLSGVAPGLSYVVNSGYWDAPSGEVPAGDFRENGVFFGRAAPNGNQWQVVRGPTVQTEQISDGLAETLVLSENIQAGLADTLPRPDAEPHSWLLSPTEQGDGFVWSDVFAERPASVQMRINQAKEDRPQNRYLSGAYCRPSSNHPGGVNVVFCDGHAQLLRDDIDYRVYQQLMTSQGGKARIPPASDLPSDELRTYDLSPRDYQ